MKATISKSFSRDLKKRVEGWEFEIGIMRDKEHKMAIESQGFNEDPPTKQYAGGPARQVSRKGSGKLISDIFIENQIRIGTNMLTAPFEKSDSDIIKFSREFLKLAFAKASEKRVTNLLQAIIRNPILRGDYGVNEIGTAELKGFNRHLIDTAQMFKALGAKITKRPK